MNKLKSTFLRYKDHEEPKRSQVFIKKLSQVEQQPEEEPTGPPKVELEDLSELESSAYLAWWKDLDPFHIGKSDNKAVFKFVSGCNLPDHILEEILSLFQNQKDGLNRQQFFAILRLIAHAQNGRTVNRDIVYLGAPLPRFQTQAIDALIAPSEEIRKSCDTMETMSSSWNSAISSHSSIGTNMPSWMIPPAASNMKVAATQSTLLSNSTLQSPLYTPHHHHHSRSRSVPYAATNFLSPDAAADSASHSPSPGLYQFDTTGVSTVKQQRNNRINHSGHVSMDQDSLQKMMDTGQSLLLTQSFKPEFNEEDDSSRSSPYSNNPYINNPFETDDSLVSTPRQEYTPPMTLPQSPPYIKSTLCNTLLLNNSCLNSDQIPPPPVPPQSTKPAYPKYARRISSSYR